MKKAFSLIELSIVLVILGLLTGGILAGQSLIRAAELRAVTSEFNRYVTATQSFRDKYFALPGDMANATQFWGKDNTNCPADSGTAATPGTCNGNGSGAWNLTGATPESFRYWQHLALAGLIEGQYDGITHGSTTYSATAANSPSSRLGTSALWYATSGWAAGTTTRFASNYGQVLTLGGMTPDNDPGTSILKPEELWNIDTKMDDGRPASGKLLSRNWSTCTNAASNTDLSATYLLTSTSLACVAIFQQLF